MAFQPDLEINITSDLPSCSLSNPSISKRINEFSESLIGAMHFHRVCFIKRLCVSQFSVFLGLIFFLELTAGILAFVFKDWIKDQLNLFINNNVKAYRDDIDLQNLIDFAQEYVSQQLFGLIKRATTPLWSISTL